jgi:hypothetical protein
VDEENRMENEGGVMTFQEWIKTYKPEPFNWLKNLTDAWEAADRNAREECIDICKKADQPGSAVAWLCAERIKETIKDK